MKKEEPEETKDEKHERMHKERDMKEKEMKHEEPPKEGEEYD